MAESILTKLHWLSTAGRTYRVLQILRIPGAAKWLLSKYESPAVKTYGFQYFPRRAYIDKEHESLGLRFANVSCVWAIWPVGAKFFHARQQTHVMKRLILPHPESESAKFFFKSTGQGQRVRDLIREATEQAYAAGAEVRWCPQFLYNAITLVDYDDPMGWAHVESVLPFCITDNRPGYTIYKHRSAESVRNLYEVFLKVWDISEDAPRNGQS
jgi:hypothetical protein